VVESSAAWPEKYRTEYAQGEVDYRETAMRFISDFFNRHPSLNLFVHKVMQDNITFLASAVAWTLLTSVVPIVVGLVAISSLFLRDPASQRVVVDHLSSALQGTLQPQDIKLLVTTSIQHSGVLAIIGVVGILWGGSNVGGVFSTVFQPIFEVNGRDFIKEKLLDLGMIFVFVALMVVIVVSTTAGAVITRLFPTAPIPGGTAFLIGTPVSFAAAFLLFLVLYLVFPNPQPRFKFDDVWRGSLVAAILFQILSFMWPLYTQVSHFSRYGAVIAPMIVLAAWIYFFSVVLMVGAEIIAFKVIQEANRTGQAVGPQPQNFVPSHTMMRDDIDRVAR
jgi:membrane protein